MDSGFGHEVLSNHAWSDGLTNEIDDYPFNDTSWVDFFVDQKSADLSLYKAGDWVSLGYGRNESGQLQATSLVKQELG